MSLGIPIFQETFSVIYAAAVNLMAQSRSERRLVSKCHSSKRLYSRRIAWDAPGAIMVCGGGRPKIERSTIYGSPKGCRVHGDTAEIPRSTRITDHSRWHVSEMENP